MRHEISESRSKTEAIIRADILMPVLTYEVKPKGCTLKSKFFTLIELLVVIAIIAILAAMILPAVSKAKDISKRIACISQQRQIALAGQAHASDRNQHFPLGAKVLATANPIILEKNFVLVGGKATNMVGSLADYLALNIRVDTVANHKADLLDRNKYRVFQCPADNADMKGVLLGPNDASTMVLSGGDNLTYVSYGNNAAFAGYDVKGSFSCSGGDMRKVMTPESVMYTGDFKPESDSNWIHPYYSENIASGSLPTYTLGNVYLSTSGTLLNRFAFDRHDSSIAVSFLDGHAEAVPFKNISSIGYGKGLKN